LNGAATADPTGEAGSAALRLDFDRRLMLQFRGSVITCDGGLLNALGPDQIFLRRHLDERKIAPNRVGSRGMPD